MDLPPEIETENDFFPKTRKSHWFLKLVGIVFLLMCIAGAAILYAEFDYTKPLTPNTVNTKQTFTVTTNTSGYMVIENLASQGFIRHFWTVFLMSYLNNDLTQFKPGIYSFNQSMSPQMMVEKLTSGNEKNFYVITIREGWDNQDIEQYLQTNNYASASDFTTAEEQAAEQYSFFNEDVPKTSLEGYIFPDTYYVYKTDTADQLISKALSNLNDKMTPQMLADIKSQGKTVHDVLTMASIIEKEVGTSATSAIQASTELDQDRKTVAGIFYNRINAGIPLQSDATVLYATQITEPSYKGEDLKVNSPYNTYTNNGLPPGPIADPSLSSIMAAIYPTKSNYLYFISKPDGSTVFASTLAEQDQNEQIYLHH